MQNNDATIYYGTVVSATYATGITTLVVSADYGQVVSSAINAVSYGFIETGSVSSIPIAIQAGSAVSGAQDTIWIDYDSTIGLRWAINSGALSSNWPIVADKATAAASNSFSTQQTSSQGIISVRHTGVNDASFVNDSTQWGLLEQTVGYAVKYDRATSKYSYGGFVLPTQTSIYGYSALPNGLIMQWGYATSSEIGRAHV